MTFLRNSLWMLTRAWRWTLLVVLLGPGGYGLAQASATIKVGITVSLSGQYAAQGQDQLEGIQMWVKDINARGALLGRKVALVYYNDQSDPETSANLYEKLISQDKVDLLLGPYSSDLTLDASTVAERHQFPMLATGAASIQIWKRGYRNIFAIDAPADTYMDLFLETVKREAALNRIALVYADTVFTREVAEGVRAKAASLDMEIVLDEGYPSDSTDFNAVVQRVRAANPDVVIGCTYLNDSVAFMRTAKRYQLSPKAFVFTAGPALIEFGTALSQDSEGVMGAVSWVPTIRVPQAQDFSYRYKLRYGHDASQYAAYGYSAGQTMEAAVRLAGSLDKDAIRTQLSEMIFRSILGRYRVDETGRQVAKPTYVMQWQKGERRLVLPRNLQEYTIQYPFKPWSER